MKGERYNQTAGFKVLIVTTAFPRWKDDGRGHFVYEAAKAIKMQGWNVRVIAMHNPGAKTYEWIDGIEVIRPRYLPDCWEILAKDSAGLPQSWRTNPWAKIVIIPFLLRHIIAVMHYSSDVDIIHANWTLSGFIVWMTQLWHRKPYVVTIQGSDVFQGLDNPIFYTISKISLECARTVISISKALLRAVHNKKIFPKKVEIIPNGVDIGTFSNSIKKYDEREKVILFVGSIFWRKGVIYLIEAFASISEVFPDFRLVLVGEGDQIPFLREKVKEYNIENKVFFKGALPHQRVMELMQSSKVLVLPSVEEGQGVVLIEAMACGTPCIASDVGGIPEIISSDVGWLVPPGDVEKLKQALLESISSEKLWIEKSKNAFEFAGTFDWSNIASRIVAVYEDVMKCSG